MRALLSWDPFREMANFPQNSFHQHIFRSEFYTVDTNTGTQTMAQWTADLLSGKLDIDGP